VEDKSWNDERLGYIDNTHSKPQVKTHCPKKNEKRKKELRMMNDWTTTLTVETHCPKNLKMWKPELIE
jgi:hypothetical protein